MSSFTKENNDTVKAFEIHWSANSSNVIPPKKIKEASVFLGPCLEKLQRSNNCLSILDIGCGNGVHCEFLKGLSGVEINYTGVDISKKAISILKELENRDGRFKFVQCDAHRLPFDDELYDIVFAYGVLGYVNSAEGVFKEMWRVCRAGGYVGFWVYPDKSGLTDELFKCVRTLCKLGGNAVAKFIANIIVPFLKFLPTASGVHLGNATWKECTEVVMASIAPPVLKFIDEKTAIKWFEKRGGKIVYNDKCTPLALWGQKY